MAPVIWGLDLKEMQWGKFKSSYMWNNEYHLRRTKFIVYQCALIFCVVSESLGTAQLSDDIDAQKYVKNRSGLYVYNNDYVGVASYNIFAGVFIAFIFGAAFFFDLFWPERHESTSVRWAWKVCGVLSCIFYLASAIALTVITFTRCQHFRGPGNAQADGARVLSQFSKDGGVERCYGHQPRAIAAVAFAWPGFLSVVGSCILLFMSIDHTEKGPGPKSAHARKRDETAALEGQHTSDGEKEKEDDSDMSGMVHGPVPPQEGSTHAGTEGARAENAGASGAETSNATTADAAPAAAHAHTEHR